MDRTILGQNIRQERLRHHLTQEQLAEKIDVSTTYIGLVERGERAVTLEKLAAIAEIFQLPIDILLQDNPTVLSDNSLDAQLQLLWKQADTRERKLILSLICAVLEQKDNNANKNDLR